MTFAKIAVFVLFCGFVVASLVVEAAWMKAGRPDLDRWGWQPKLLYGALLLIAVQIILYAIADREPKAGPRKRGFQVMPKDKAQ